MISINPIQDREGVEVGKKALPPYHFSPVTSASVGVSPQNVLTFNFNPFATLA